jgi:hypothetical protein
MHLYDESIIRFIFFVIELGCWNLEHAFSVITMKFEENFSWKFHKEKHEIWYF